MSCPNCHTTSCYICRQVITSYDHFTSNQVGILGGFYLLSMLFPGNHIHVTLELFSFLAYNFIFFGRFHVHIIP